MAGALSWDVWTQRPLFLYIFCVFLDKRLHSSTLSRCQPLYSSGRLKPRDLRSRRRSSMLVLMLLWNFDSIAGHQRKKVLSHNIQYIQRNDVASHLQSMFRQQLKILQQARVVQNQKLKMVRELYEQFVKVTMSELHIYPPIFFFLLIVIKTVWGPLKFCHQPVSPTPPGHGGDGEEPQHFSAGGTTRAEEGNGHTAEEDPHRHGECKVPRTLRAVAYESISFYLQKHVIQMVTFKCSFELIQP